MVRTAIKALLFIWIYLFFGLGQAQETDPFKACKRCHGNGGRPQPDGMQSVTANMSDEERNALLHYYASDL